MTSPGILDQVLHRFALESRRFRRFCFKRQCEHNDRVFDRHREHVFITGVARSGSTALLNALYEGGGFASTTYQLMPFVLAPSLSSVIAGIPKKTVAPTQRRHNDSIKIDLNSAEALDGIFWNTYLPRHDHHIQPREVELQTLHYYAMFIENLLIHFGKSRYLSKMNQGIEWVASLAGYFDRSVFLVPFRDPVQQAASLLNQHNNFSRLSSYESKYLGWLEHHEFGATHLGFFEHTQRAHPAFSPQDINYWLEQWQNGYSYLLRLVDLHPNIMPICYEQMAASPSGWSCLSSRLGIDISGKLFVNRNDEKLKLAFEIDDSLLEACQLLYAKLSEQAGIRIC
ncbi:MAG: sulfotransferase [Aestuariibacter sp.]|nr:sulfotransferase [Aestuariibacter sp.]